MMGIVQQLNRGLLLSRRVHEGPPPYMYRKAWRNLLTISSNLQGTLSESLQRKLENSLQTMLNLDKRDSHAAAGSLEYLADNVAAQGDEQIPRAQADALLTALRQMMPTR